MKINTIISLALILSCSTSVFAQSSLTNSVDNALIGQRGKGRMGNLMYGTHSGMGDAARDVSRAFGVRISVEDASMQTSPLSAAFTNATLEHVLTSVLTVYTNHVWQYYGQTDTLVIHPNENAVSMRRCERVSVTNMPLEILLSSEEILGFRKNGIGFLVSRGNLGWLESEVSLEMEDVTIAEVLNAICAQLPFRVSWDLIKTEPMFGCGYFLNFLFL